MQYRVLPPHYHLILDVLVTAVLLTNLGLASLFFIQAREDFVFVLGRNPALNWLGLGMPPVTPARAGFFSLGSCLLACLAEVGAETAFCHDRHPPGLPSNRFHSRRAVST
jgi:ABC-type bacteriocin/lantibiotic exporter with double-glycine peptidase domain